MVICSCIAFFPNIIITYIYIPDYALEIQIHLILITTTGGRYYHYFRFIGEETGIERLSNLPNITMQAKWQRWHKSSLFGSRIHTVQSCLKNCSPLNTCQNEKIMRKEEATLHGAIKQSIQLFRQCHFSFWRNGQIISLFTSQC